jgi:hypothetical protein
MKRLLLLSAILLVLISCKKKDFAPEGPTDIRIRNNTSQDFIDLVIGTSEYEEDVFTFASIPAGTTSEYHRFRKAYPKAEISLKLNTGGSLVGFSTSNVDYTFMQYLSTQRVTMVVDIVEGIVIITDVIPEEELVLK